MGKVLRLFLIRLLINYVAYTSAALDPLRHLGPPPNSAICLAGRIRPALIENDKFTASTAEVVRSFPNSTCYIFLEIPAVLSSLHFVKLLNPWLDGYRKVFEGVCVVKVREAGDIYHCANIDSSLLPAGLIRCVTNPRI